MNKLTLFTAIWLIVMVLATPLWALDLRNYDKRKSDVQKYDLNKRQFDKLYIYGVGVGYSWANNELRRRNQPPMYCEPKSLGLNANNYMSILDKEIQVNKDKYPLGIPVELILLDVLKKTFPCGEK